MMISFCTGDLTSIVEVISCLIIIIQEVIIIIIAKGLLFVHTLFNAVGNSQSRAIPLINLYELSQRPSRDTTSSTLLIRRKVMMMSSLSISSLLKGIFLKSAGLELGLDLPFCEHISVSPAACLSPTELPRPTIIIIIDLFYRNITPLDICNFFEHPISFTEVVVAQRHGTSAMRKHYSTIQNTIFEVFLKINQIHFN